MMISLPLQCVKLEGKDLNDIEISVSDSIRYAQIILCVNSSSSSSSSSSSNSSTSSSIENL